MLPSQSKSTAEKLLDKHKQAEERKDLSKKEFLELRKACRGIFSTRNGVLVARAMMKISCINRYPKNNTNPIAMGEQHGREEMYAFFVKNMVTPEQLIKIERGE